MPTHDAGDPIYGLTFDVLRIMTEAAAPSFLGLTLDQAERLAQAIDRTVRIADGPSTFAFDYRRLNLTVTNGIITEAGPG